MPAERLGVWEIDARTDKLSSRTILLRHVLATLLIWIGYGVTPLVPVLARLEFGAGDWQTMLITAAFPTLLALSIFWNEALRRMSTTRYLWLYWLVAAVPLALIGLTQSYWQLLACFLVAAVGQAGWSGVEGQLLKRLYSDQRRGRVFGVVNVAKIIGGMFAAGLFGWLLSRNPESFRVVLPVAAGLEAAGIALLASLVRRVERTALPGAVSVPLPADRAGPESAQTDTPRDSARAPVVGVSAGALAESEAAAAGVAALGPGPVNAAAGMRPAMRRRWSDLISPVLNMNRVLRADPIFLRYEQAFMTYGLGWMIGHALLPILATTHLNMSYQQFANATQVALSCSMLVFIYPLGWLNDRIGPIRTSAFAFATLALYPLGLLAAGGPVSVAVITVWYGIGMAGVQMGWMLGPVALAGRPERVPQYVAIHATLVGIRAIIGQGLGIGIYRLTGSLTGSFVLAALFFLLAAVQMLRLHKQMPGAARQAPERSAPEPEARAVPLESAIPLVGVSRSPAAADSRV